MYKKGNIIIKQYYLMFYSKIYIYFTKIIIK